MADDGIMEWEDIPIMLRVRIDARLRQFRPAHVDRDGSLINPKQAESDGLGIVHMVHVGMDDRVFGAVLRHRLVQLSGVRIMRLGMNAIGDDGAKLLADQAKNFPALAMLDLSHNKIGDDGAIAMAENAKDFAALTTLDLSSNNITSARAVLGILKATPRVQLARIYGNPLRVRPDGLAIEESFLSDGNARALIDSLEQFIKGEGVSEHRFGRLVYLGPEKNGKSTLFNLVSREPRIREPIKERDRTVGFITTPLPLPRGAKPMRVVSIDTGGQMEQLRSQFNFIYRNTARTVFCLVLNRQKTWDENRAKWYLKMLNTYHKPGQPKINVLLTTTHCEPSERNVLTLPDDPGQEYPYLNITIRDPNVFGKTTDNVLKMFERQETSDSDSPTRTALWDIFQNDPSFTTETLDKYASIEEALRGKFELDTNPDALPKVASMSMKSFRTWLKKKGMAKMKHATACRYIRDCVTAAIPGLNDDTPEERRAHETLGKKPKDPLAKVTTVFNPKFLNNFVYTISMDTEIKKTMGFVSEHKMTEMMAAIPADQHRALTDLLEEHKILIKWVIRKPGGRSENGWLVPDQLGAHPDPFRGLAKNHYRATVTTTHWLGEHRFFELLADRGQANVRPIDGEIDQEEGAPGVRGVWRNRFCVKLSSGVYVTLGIDVFKGTFVMLFDEGSDVFELRGIAKALAAELTEETGCTNDIEPEWVGPPPQK